MRQQPKHLGQLVLATQERGGRDRQVRPVQALERREVVVSELVDPLGCRQILQTVLAEVAQLVRAQEGSRGGRDQHLSAVAAGGDPGRPVHVDSDVTLLGHVRRAGMDAHPHPDPARGKPCQRLG